MIHVAVCGLHAQLDPMEADRWRLQLGPRLLPQRVQVLFSGTLQPPQWQQQTAVLQAPRLDGIPVEQTLWTVQGPTTGDIELVPGRARLDPVAHELLRLDKTTALVDAASEVMADRDKAEISRWYLPWARRLIASHVRAAQWHAALSAGSDPNGALAVPEAKHEDIAIRLGVKALKTQSESGNSQVTETADVWRTALSRPVPTRRCAIAGERQTIEFRHSVDAKDTRAERWASVTILLGIALVCLVVIPNPPFQRCLSRCPQILGIPLGIAWWLWLPFSMLGLIILLLAGLGSIGPLRRAIRFRY